MDYQEFRQQARQAFADLIVSVMMYDNGSGAGGELTIYRIKVQGMPIGSQAITSQADSGVGAINELIRQVAAARQRVQADRAARFQRRSY